MQTGGHKGDSCAGVDRVMLYDSTVAEICFQRFTLFHKTAIVSIHNFYQSPYKISQRKRHKETPIMHSQNHQNESQRMLGICDSRYPHDETLSSSSGQQNFRWTLSYFVFCCCDKILSTTNLERKVYSIWHFTVHHFRESGQELKQEAGAEAGTMEESCFLAYSPLLP